MKAFRYVIYAVIDLQLDGILHIGNGDDDSIGLAVNSQGQYIIPATGFAGPVRHGIGEKSDSNDSNNKYDKYCRMFFHTLILPNCNYKYLVQHRGTLPLVCLITIYFLFLVVNVYVVIHVNNIWLQK